MTGQAECAYDALCSVRAAHHNEGMGRINQTTRGLPHRRFLKEWRDQRGLTQTQLAERIGELLQNERLDHTRISKIERGVESVTEPMLFAWADALKVEPGWLFVRPDVVLRQNEALKLIERHSAESVIAMLSAVEAMRKAG